MPALRIGEEHEFLQQPEPFGSEYDLREILARYPALLAGPDDPPLATVCRELEIAGGFADLVLVDAEGTIVVVTTALAGAGEERRGVTGRLIASLSAVAKLSADEIDARSEGALEAQLRAMAAREADEEGPEERYRAIRNACKGTLEDGRIRGVAVLDRAESALIRELGYLNEQSAPDLRLAVVERYRLSKGERFYHARFLVGGPAQEEPRLRFRRVIGAFGKMLAPGNTLRRDGPRAARVLREDWGSAVRYAFCDENGGISIELQVQTAARPAVAAFLPRLHDHLRDRVSDTEEAVLVDDDGGWSRLRFRFAETVPEERIALLMARLIAVTEKDIGALVREKPA